MATLHEPKRPEPAPLKAYHRVERFAHFTHHVIRERDLGDLED